MSGGQDNRPPIATILSWNIDGKHELGTRAEPRNLLVPRVVDNVDPDVLLLQETRTKKLIKKIMQQRRQSRIYKIYEPGNPTDKKEARVVYDSKIFEPTNEQVQLDTLVTNVYPSDEKPPVSLKEVRKIFKKRVAVVRLRHIATGRVFIFMSFHNKYKIKENKRRFLARMLCCCVSANMTPNDTLVVAGADFNIIDFEHADVPLYTPTQRRQNNMIDYFVARNHDITAQGHVSALDIFQGGDAQFNPVWEDLNEYMQAHRRFTQGQFRDSLDHDPLMYTLE